MMDLQEQTVKRERDREIQREIETERDGERQRETEKKEGLTERERKT